MMTSSAFAQAEQLQKSADVGGGAFTSSLSDDGKTQWLETSDIDPNFKATFTEVKRDKDWILIFDGTRNYTVALPVAGGMSQISSDGGGKWSQLYKLERMRTEAPAQDPAQNKRLTWKDAGIAKSFVELGGLEWTLE